MKIYQFKNLNLNNTKEEYEKELNEWDHLKIGQLYTKNGNHIYKKIDENSGRLIRIKKEVY